MKADIKTKWVEALRSGRYKQARGALKCEDWEYGNLYCCLGVLGDVVGAKFRRAPTGYQEMIYKGEVRVNHLPNKMMDEVELDTGQLRILMEMNDGTYTTSPCSFTDIADWIEENL